MAQHVPGRRSRPRLRPRLGATCSTSWPRAAPRLGPAGAPAAPAAGGAPGRRRVVHLTSVHRPRDVRIFHKEARAVAAARAATPGWRRRACRCAGRGASPPAGGWRGAARARDADLYHVHDPELLPAALWLARATGRPVVYDVHEYLGQTTRTKRWLPGPLRRPWPWRRSGRSALGARRLAGVVTANEDLAARFAARRRARRERHQLALVRRVPGARRRCRPSRWPSTSAVWGRCAASRSCGGPSRCVDVPGARLVLAGPGDPGVLPPGRRRTWAWWTTPRCRPSSPPRGWRGSRCSATATTIARCRRSSWRRWPPDGRWWPATSAGWGRWCATRGAVSWCRRTTWRPTPPRSTRLLADPAEAARMGAAGRAAFLDGLGFEAQARGADRRSTPRCSGR